MCETVFCLRPYLALDLEGGYKEKLYFIFLDLCFKLQLCSVSVTGAEYVDRSDKVVA